MAASAISFVTQAQDDEPKARARIIGAEGPVGRRAEVPQIKVISDYPFIRVKFRDYSRSIRSQLRNQLGLFKDEDWNTRILIYVYGSGDDVYSGPEIQLRAQIEEATNQFVVWINVKLHDRFDPQQFRLQLIRLLLIEQMLSAHKDNPGGIPDGVRLDPPAWLLHGFDHSLRHRELGRPSYFYSGYLKNGQLLNVEKIFDPTISEGLTPLSLEVFRSSSAILIDALCGQKKGGESMRGLLTDLGKNPKADSLKLVQKNFPTFREIDQGIEKWWALQLATMSEQQSFEFLSLEQTQELLWKALSFEVPEDKVASAKPVGDPNGKGLFDRIKKSLPKGKGKGKASKGKPALKGTLADYQKLEDRVGNERKFLKQLYQSNFSNLAALKVKAFPLYHSIIDQYLVLCDRLMKGDKNGLDAEFAKLKRMEQDLIAKMEGAQDYMNYYEATRSPKRSVAFDNYIKFKEEMRTRASSNHTDPISNYLDEIERRFAK